MTITGRYTGGHPFDPAQPWSMQVVTPGFVGARSTTPSPGNPPVVQFTFMSGPPGAPIRQTVQKTLDAALPAGAPVEIADGVYAVFSAGVLSKAGASAEFIVDGRGDSAGLLPALGINSLFTGSTAKDLAVDGKIVADPSRLANGRTRSAGDGSTLVEIAALRDARIGAGGLTLGEGWQTTATAIGIRRQTAERQGDIQASLQKSVESQRESFSGVNIDDEVGLLIQQQQAYSAAARVVTFARENIQTLLDLVR
jgi:flagellar hook-associated protein 1 FlgK